MWQNGMSHVMSSNLIILPRMQEMQHAVCRKNRETPKRKTGGTSGQHQVQQGTQRRAMAFQPV